MGNSETISRRSGYFCRASCWVSRYATISSSVMDWPGLGITKAQARSCSRGSGIPTMATPAILGWAKRRFSTSTTGMFSPPRMITSFDRPVMETYPSRSSAARSPVLNQPSGVWPSAVKTGRLK